MAKLDEQINRLGLWAVLVVLITFVTTLFLPLDAPGGLSATQVERVDWLQEQPKHLYFGLDQSTACDDGAHRRVSQHNLANQAHQPAARPHCRPRHVRIIYCLSRTKVHCHLEHPAIGTSHRNRCGEPRYGGRFAFDSECFIAILALYGVRLLGLLAVRAFRFAHNGPAVRSFASG